MFEIKVDTSGLDRAIAGMERLGRQQAVQLGEILNPSFMRRNTQFGSLEEMLDESEWTVESVEDFAAIPDGPWDTYVKRTTNFRDWNEMQESAAQEWISKRVARALRGG